VFLHDDLSSVQVEEFGESGSKLPQVKAQGSLRTPRSEVVYQESNKRTSISRGDARSRSPLTAWI
jgi:hypothetical protein